MLRKLLDYGLKESYDFKEIHVPTSHELADVHDKIFNCISPAIIELESLKLINGFHFILHEKIDLRISAENWNKNEKGIKKILRKYKLSDDLNNWEPLSPEKYGGVIGVILCYNNLEFNSRLISALIDTQKHTDNTAKKDQQRWLLYNRWVHYLYIQYGVTNHVQSQREFQNSLIWLKAFVNSNPENREVKNFANRILDDFSNKINQLKNEFNK
ncbi:hypothetical protein ES702_01290 [subsurface metagenome]